MSVDSAAVPDDAFIPHTAARVRLRVLIGAVVLLAGFCAATRTWVPLAFLALPAALAAAAYHLRVTRFRAGRRLIYPDGSEVSAVMVNRQVDTRTGFHMVKVRFEVDGRSHLREAQVSDKVAIRSREGATVSVLVHPQISAGFLPAAVRTGTVVAAAAP